MRTKSTECWFYVELRTGAKTSETVEIFPSKADADKFIAAQHCPGNYFLAVSGPGYKRGIKELEESR